MQRSCTALRCVAQQELLQLRVNFAWDIADHHPHMNTTTTPSQMSRRGSTTTSALHLDSSSCRLPGCLHCSLSRRCACSSLLLSICCYCCCLFSCPQPPQQHGLLLCCIGLCCCRLCCQRLYLPQESSTGAPESAAMPTAVAASSTLLASGRGWPAPQSADRASRGGSAIKQNSLPMLLLPAFKGKIESLHVTIPGTSTTDEQHECCITTPTSWQCSLLPPSTP